HVQLRIVESDAVVEGLARIDEDADARLRHRQRRRCGYAQFERADRTRVARERAGLEAPQVGPAAEQWLEEHRPASVRSVMLDARNHDQLTDEPDVSTSVDGGRVERAGPLPVETCPRHLREDRVPRQAGIEARINRDVGAHRPHALALIRERDVVEARAGTEPQAVDNPSFGAAPYPSPR